MKLLLSTLLAIVLLFISSCGSDNLTQGALMPDFKGQNLNAYEGEDDTVTLSEFKGKMVIVAFWVTWCPYCARETPNFIELQDEFGSDGLEIIGISNESEETIETYLSKNEDINFKIVRLSPEEAYDKYQFRQPPSNVFIGKDGRIVGLHDGFLTNRDFNDLRGFIIRYLNIQGE